jgi:hypothetical protein
MMATKGPTRVPEGFLDWGVVHSITPDLGVLMHTAYDDQYIYTAYTKASKWEIRQWKTDSLQYEPPIRHKHNSTLDSNSWSCCHTRLFHRH